MPFEVQVVSPERVAWQGQADEVIIPAQDGAYGLLPHHADALFQLAPGIIEIKRPEGGEPLVLFLNGGFARFENNRLSVAAGSAEFGKEIDVDRAQRAEKRANDRMMTFSSDIDFDRAMLALKRAQARLALVRFRT